MIVGTLPSRNSPANTEPIIKSKAWIQSAGIAWYDRCLSAKIRNVLGLNLCAFTVWFGEISARGLDKATH
jgi:hypothetical protein